MKKITQKFDFTMSMEVNEKDIICRIIKYEEDLSKTVVTTGVYTHHASLAQLQYPEFVEICNQLAKGCFSDMIKTF